ncbi:MAG: class I SAM-dependent methyltransferase [Mesorhizobium sp.]|nr:MAG: class I SAM-dependent methyltransferase [Mesorhizobium sp.]
MKCRNCGSAHLHPILDLQSAPVSNAFLTSEALKKAEPYYPLKVYVCADCKFAQVADYQSAEYHFNSDYVYFSSMSEAFVKHAKDYVDLISERLGLNAQSFVVEAASNDGYLLQHFKNRGVPCLGVEPSSSTVKVALSRGIDTVAEFFTTKLGRELREKRGPADLFVGNNVLAHVPDINDFIGGISALLKDSGTATLEFPHLLTLIQDVQFDTVYHEHYSYISLYSIRSAMERHGLYVYNVDELSVHGGSLRIYCAKKESGIPVDGSVARVLQKEIDAGLDNLDVYLGFQERVDRICNDFLGFVISEKSKGRSIVGYGAAAKGNTFLNYCGVKANLIDYVCDLTPAKQGKFLPGSHIPVYSEERLRETKPDYIVILPWNWRNVIVDRLAFTREWGARFIVAIPNVQVF